MDPRTNDCGPALASTWMFQKTKQAGWAAGLQEAVSTLAHRLGPNKTLISNYPTTEALALCTGGMMERGGSIRDIEVGVGRAGG